jgi:Tol biopolymer transport system component
MRKLISFAFALASFSAAAFSAERYIAFEREDAVYIANLDGTNEKKLADGIFPAISPDGTRIAFNTVERTSDTTYVRHMAVADVASGNVNDGAIEFVSIIGPVGHPPVPGIHF